MCDIIVTYLMNKGVDLELKIQVLGTGCPKCKKLADMAEKVARELGLDYEVEKVTDINKIISFGVMATPALAVDGKVVITGKVPSEGALRDTLRKLSGN